MGPAMKRRKLSPPEEEGAAAKKSSGTIATATANDTQTTDTFYANASKWSLEQDYERRPRKLKKKDQKASERLPIKTAEGWVEHKEEPVAEPEPEAAQEGDNDNDSFLGSGDEDEDADDGEQEEEVKPEIPLRQQIITAKEELAKLASNVSEDPEENIANLKLIGTISASPIAAIKKLGLATQLAVYKDIIPGYRIRPLTDEDMRSKLSRDIRKLRNFEQALLGGYHDYIQALTKAAKHSGQSGDAKAKERAGIANVAITCACTLLNAVPHFNFRGNLLNILVGKLSTRQVDQDFAKCRESIETLFRDDEDGNASLEAVQMLTKMMKSRNYHIHESVLNTFLHLRLLSEFAHKASTNRIDKAQDDEPVYKMKKKDREFRSKKERKRMKEVKVVEKELQEADATVSHEERDKHQADMLKLVFVAYFRILKAREPSLMGAVLEGLARYAHLINQDFFGDILEALREMIATAEIIAQEDDGAEDSDDESDDVSAPKSTPRNLNRESLLCIITAFALLQGQHDVVKSANSLHLDLDFFITHLYRTLLPSSLNPDIELSAKSLHLRDPHTGEVVGGAAAAAAAASNDKFASSKERKVNIQTTTVLLLRSLSSALLPPTSLRSVPPLRVAAFTKQLLTASLQLPEKSCLAMLGLLTQVMRVHGKKASALWYTEERRGDGVFNALAKGEVEGSNPFAATVWEGELLRLHFCPQIKEAVVGLEKTVVRSRS